MNHSTMTANCNRSPSCCGIPTQRQRLNLYHDIPKSVGVENALKRARQMLDIRWTPVERFPSGVSSSEPAGTPKIRRDFHYAPWRPRTGMAYSSVRRNEKYVGFNVSIETFMTALYNPKSVLYTRSHHGDVEITNMLSYYGIVCSCFGSYVCGLPYRTSGARIIDDPDVTEIGTDTLEPLELCDLVINRGTHVAVITDIQRDINGHVHFITVSESVLPLCVSNTYSADEFRKCWLDQGYHIYRYAGVHNQSYEPSPYVYVEGDPVLEKPPVNTALMSIFGDKANTRLDEAVEFTVFEKDWTAVEITDSDGAVTQLPIDGDTAVFHPQKAGFYTAACTRDGAMSQKVHFAVTDSTVAINAEQITQGGKLELTFRTDAPETPVLYIINRVEGCTERQRGYFTDTEMASGKAEIPVNLIPGNYYVYTVARNSYGFYASVPSHFTVTAAE